MDRVKIINNTLGHAVGDMLLKAVAERITHCCGPMDSLYRLGGDEFTIIVPSFDDKKQITDLTRRIFKALVPSFNLDGHDIYTTASIGISYFPDHGVDDQILCRNAETAMYRAKRMGRNNAQVFTSEMIDEMFEELSIGNHLRRALEQEEFVIHYQPQVNVSSGEITGLEALLRWNHPKFGMVSPTRFIRWAEDSGFIVPLGQWVLKNACTQAKLWHDLGHRNISVAVNLSARQFEEGNLVKTVFQVLEESHLSPGALDLELTESLLVEKSEYLKSIPFELQKAGVRFSIDDFGKGYSSLTYLKHFPAQTLKMDQSFVQDVTLNDDDAAIASAVVGLGHSLDLTVLAEGIETDGQLEFFRRLKCDKVQGFYLSKPLPADQVDAILKAQKPFSGDPLFSSRFTN